jgi:ABC-type branched-subunit amino acid transport system substrate-binding protein
VDAAAARAEELGLPLVSLNPRADERPTAGRHVFHAMHSAEQRARILARRAKAAGLDRFAILAPDSGYGKAVAGAFAEQVGAQGGTVVVRVDYARDAKSFAKEVKKLDGKWQAVFVPEQADRLELIAPALAAAGLVPRPPGGKVGKKQGRAIVLLSTAEGMGADYVRDAGRHSVGALLAPGFYPDAGDPTIGAFVERYQAAHGRLPEVVDAYAHDAALAIAVAAGREASRSAVTRYLEAVEVEGATGTVKFGKDHRRSDDGVVFTVEDDGVTVKTLR